MKEGELKAIIRAKNKAWARLTAATRRILAYQQTHRTPSGYDPLPDGWEERRTELEDAYREARQRYITAMLGRRC